MDALANRQTPYTSIEQLRITKTLIASIAALSLNACAIEPQQSRNYIEYTQPTIEASPSSGEVSELSFDEVLDTTFDFGAAQTSVADHPDQFTPLINPFPDDPANPYYEDYALTAPIFNVTYTDGKLTYSDATIGQTLQDDPKKQLIDAIAVNKDLLESAFKNNSLDIVNFRLVKEDAIPDSYSAAKPQYIPKDYMNTDGGGGIYMTFDSTDTQTVADIATMLRHETLHALTSTSNLYTPGPGDESPRAIDGEAINAYSNACHSLRTLALNQVANNSTEVIRQLESVAASVEWVYSSQIQAIIQSIKDGSIATMQPAPGNRIITTNAVVEECVTLPPKRMLLSLMRANGIDTEAFLASMTDEARSQLGLTLNSWGDALRDQTFYKSIRESPYLEKPMAGELEGHPWDTWEELVASTLNVAMTFPDLFSQNYAKLSIEEQLVIKKTLQLNATEFQQLHPELTDHHNQLRQLISGL